MKLVFEKSSNVVVWKLADLQQRERKRIAFKPRLTRHKRINLVQSSIDVQIISLSKPGNIPPNIRYKVDSWTHEYCCAFSHVIYTYIALNMNKQFMCVINPCASNYDTYMLCAVNITLSNTFRALSHTAFPYDHCDHYSNIAILHIAIQCCRNIL